MLKSTGGKPYKFYFSEIDNKHNKRFDIFHIETSIWMFFSFFHYLIYFINIHQLTTQTVYQWEILRQYYFAVAQIKNK